MAPNTNPRALHPRAPSSCLLRGSPQPEKATMHKYRYIQSCMIADHCRGGPVEFLRSAHYQPFDTTNMTRPSTATKAPIRLRRDGPCFYQRQLDQGQHPPKPRTTFIRFSLHIRSGPRSSRRPVLAPNPYLRACILWEVMRKTPSRPPVRSMVALEPAVSGRTEKIGYVPSNIGPVRTLVNTLVTRTCLSDP